MDTHSISFVAMERLVAELKDREIQAEDRDDHEVSEGGVGEITPLTTSTQKILDGEYGHKHYKRK